MKNPFEDLGAPRLDNPAGEEVSGAFSCQERGCYSTVTTARYLQEVQLLTWKCQDEHINKVEGFRLDG